MVSQTLYPDNEYNLESNMTEQSFIVQGFCLKIVLFLSFLIFKLSSFSSMFKQAFSWNELIEYGSWNMELDDLMALKRSTPPMNRDIYHPFSRQPLYFLHFDLFLYTD